MKKISVFLLVLFSVLVFSQNGLRPIAKKISTEHSKDTQFQSYDVFDLLQDHEKLREYKTLATDISVLELKNDQLEKIMREKPEFIEISFPFENGEITVEMMKTNIFTDSFNVKTSEGKTLNYNPGVYYQGIVKGDVSSVVAFSFFDDNVIGIASKLDIGNIVVGKVKNSNQFVSYSDATMSKGNPFVCEVDEMMQNEINKISFDPNAASNKKALTQNCVRIYYEVCYAPYVNNNSDATLTTNWLTAIHNNIQTLYTNDDVKVALNAIYIWTTADPYTGTHSQNLNAFRNNTPTFDGDLAHLINHPSTTSVAYLNSLCTDLRYAYSGISMNYNTVPTYSWTVQAMTHEMGHSLGSPHTHNCSWNGNNTSIDGCGYDAGQGGCPGPTPTNGGTIMSYCHLISGVGINLALGFGPQPGALIRSTVDSKACLGTNCITSCPVTISNLNVNNITSNSANGVILDTASTSWKYRLRKFDGTVVQTGIASASNLPLNSLQPNTYYILDVGTDCSAPDAYQRSRMFMTDDAWCQGKTFTDTGGTNGNYLDNTTFTKTFYPSSTNGKVTIDFTSLDLEQDYDFISIYNGPSAVASAVFANGNLLTGLVAPISFTSTHSTGAITVRFISDEYVTSSGWIATLSCAGFLSTNELSLNEEINIYPNPVKNTLYIQARNKVKSYTIFDEAGRKIKFANHLKSQEININVSDLVTGNYLISLETEGKNYTKKFVKE